MFKQGHLSLFKLCKLSFVFPSFRFCFLLYNYTTETLLFIVTHTDQNH